MDLEGKVISFLGDSNFEANRIVDVENDRFDYVLKRICNLKRVNNYGVSGTRIAHQSHPSPKARHDGNFCIRAWDMDKKSDVIVVMGGSNDYGSGDAPLGNPGDEDRTTFCGSLEYLCNTLKELYPKAKIVFLTPPHCICDYLPSPDPLKVNCPEKHILVDYVDMVIKIATSHQIPVFDMFRDLGIDLSDPKQAEKYSFDGMHFNVEANHIIGEKLAAFLMSL